MSLPMTESAFSSSCTNNYARTQQEMFDKKRVKNRIKIEKKREKRKQEQKQQK